MCGIVGVVSKEGGFTGEAVDIFEELLWIDGLRGMDSTGVFSVDHKNEVEVVKQAADPGIFLRTKAYDGFKERLGKRGRIAVGHNRKATIGNISSRNAHPFVDKKITLVHNGYISNHKSIDSTKEVDSETIITALKSDSNYLKGLEKLFGAFAIVWYDHDKKKLFLTRNNDRPLFYCQTGLSFFFASEEGMLDWRLKEHKLVFDAPQAVPANKVLEVSLSPFKIEGVDIPKSYAGYPPIHNSHRSRNLSSVMTDRPDEYDMEVVPDAEFELTPRETKKPGPNAGGDEKLKYILATYVQGQKVFFIPSVAIPRKEDDTILVNGTIWIPGADPAVGSWTCDKSKDDRDLWIPNPAKAPLVAFISCVTRRGDETKVVIHKVREAIGDLKDWNGQLISKEEWAMVKNRHGCSECADMGSNFVEAEEGDLLDTSILNRKDGQYTLICSKCVAKKYATNEVGPKPGETKDAVK